MSTLGRNISRDDRFSRWAWPFAGALVVVNSSSDAFASTTAVAESESLTLSDARVDLTIDATRSTFATGSIGGTSAVFRGSPFGGQVKGSMLGTSLEGAISQRDQVPQGSNYVTTTKVSGAVGKGPTTLLGTFTVGSNYFFEYGTITGETLGQPVKVFALPNKNFDTTSAVTVAGQFGVTKFSLVAVIPVGGRGSLSGTVASKAVHFELAPVKGRAQSIRLTGKYSGPRDLLALIVGAVSYFAG